MTDFRALCAELVDCLEKANWPLRHKTVFEICLHTARDALAQPEPQGPGPTDEEILALSQWHEVSYTLSNGSVVYPLQEGSDMKDAVLSFTREALARWGRPVVEPVPVSERLRGPEDCDAEGRCWLLYRSASVNRTPTWSLVHRRSILDADYTHWLPHWALPVPKSNSITQGDQ